MDIVASCINYDNCCRTCLSDSTEEMCDIFEYSKELVNIHEMLSNYTSIKVEMEDQLPKKMCSSCYNCLISFHNFANSALNADMKLREYFYNVKPQLKEEIVSCGVSDNEGDINTFTSSIKKEIDIDPDTNDCSQTYSIKDNIENTSTENIPPVIHSKFKTARENKKRIKLEKQETKEYPCTLCTEIFQNHKLYVQHLLSHSENCNEKLVTTEQSVTQENNVNMNQSLVCEVCLCSYKSIQSLSAHKKAHIAKGRVLKCPVCNKIFKKISHLKRHELSHKDNRPFKCTICTKAYASEEYLMAHINMHNGVKNHCCPLCTRTFCHLRSLTNHLKLHTSANLHLCPACGKMFPSLTNLTQHMSRHAGLKSFACNLCPQKFFTKGELKMHSLTHSGERPFACDQCTATFTRRSSLEKHKFRHLGVKPHQCDVCPMKFLYKNHLKRHYRIHTGEKPYRCEICDRAYRQTNDLEKHKRSHLGNNLYKCDECGQSFRLKTELRRHIPEHYRARLQSKANSEQAPTNGELDSAPQTNS